MSGLNLGRNGCTRNGRSASAKICWVLHTKRADNVSEEGSTSPGTRESSTTVACQELLLKYSSSECFDQVAQTAAVRRVRISRGQ